MPILLVGDPRDLTMVYVAWAATRRGLDVLECPEDSLGVTWSFSYRDTPACSGAVTAGGRSAGFDEIGGAFVRLNPAPTLPPETGLEDERAAVLIEERRAGLEQFLDDLPCTVVNRPLSGRSNCSKPYQMSVLARRGLRVPEWVATNDAAVARAFSSAQPHGAIYKSSSGLRSHVRRVDDDFLARISEGPPVVVQAYVPGADARVHVAGGQVFGTAVEADTIDYRFDEGEKSFGARDVPADIAGLCVAAAGCERLVLAGFDFRVSEDGAWHCLEMNPVPTFLPYALGTGQPIVDAIIDAMLPAA